MGLYHSQAETQVATRANVAQRPRTQTIATQNTPRGAQRKGKAKRGALRLVTLNMKGGGSGATRNKWYEMNQIMWERNIDILAIQETHL